MEQKFCNICTIINQLTTIVNIFFETSLVIVADLFSL